MPKQRDAAAPGLPLGAAAQPEPASTETETPADEAAGQEEGGELIAGPDATLEDVGQIVADRAAAELAGEGAGQDGLTPAVQSVSEPITAADLVPEPDRPGEWVVTLLPPDEAYLRGVTPELLEAMCLVMEGVDTIRKDARNNYSNYQYASVDSFFSMIRPLLATNKLVPIPQLEEVTTTSKHMVQRFAMFLLHAKGGRLGPLRAEAAAPIDMGPQAYGGAQAYALKFWLRGLFLISAEERGEDPDERPQVPLDQRRDPRPAPRQQPAQPRQQRQQDGTNMPPIAPPPDDGDAPGRIPMASRGEAAPREKSPFASDHKKLTERLRVMGISIRSCIDSFGVDSIEKLNAAQLREANQILDDTQRERDAKAKGQ